MKLVENFPDLNILVKKTVKGMEIRANRLLFFGNTSQDIKAFLQKPMKFIDSIRYLLSIKEVITLKYWYMCEITPTLLNGDEGIFNFLQDWLDQDLPKDLVEKGDRECNIDRD